MSRRTNRTLLIEFDEAQLQEISAKLETLPEMLREKILKKALREGAEIFTARVKHNIEGIQDLPSKRTGEKKERWGRESEYPLDQSIRTRTLRNTTNEVSVGIDIHGKGDVPRLRAYAASVEYGHDMVVFGRKIEGERVPEYQYWRPAKTATEKPIFRVIMRAINRLEELIVFQGK